LEHDLWQQSVGTTTGYILLDARAKKISIEPVEECIHVELNDNMTNPPGASGECPSLVFSSLSLHAITINRSVPSRFIMYVSVGLTVLVYRRSNALSRRRRSAATSGSANTTVRPVRESGLSLLLRLAWAYL
jgi:hypothetical protein